MVRKGGIAGGGGRGVPEHDEDVGDVVHALVVHEVKLFVRGGHKQEAGGLSAPVGKWDTVTIDLPCTNQELSPIW